MTSDEIRAMEVPSNSITALLLRELVAQVSQVNASLTTVIGAQGINVLVGARDAGGLPVVVEPTPQAASGAKS
jgi:hypothetical protein